MRLPKSLKPAIGMFALLIATNAKAQTIEKLDLVLGPPTYNNDRHDGYYYEVRGNVYAKGAAFNCEVINHGPMKE